MCFLHHKLQQYLIVFTCTNKLVAIVEVAKGLSSQCEEKSGTMNQVNVLESQSEQHYQYNGVFW